MIATFPINPLSNHKKNPSFICYFTGMNALQCCYRHCSFSSKQSTYPKTFSLQHQNTDFLKTLKKNQAQQATLYTL